MKKRTMIALTAAVVTASIATVPLLTADASAIAGNPLTRTKGFFVDPQSPAARWVAAHPSDSRAASVRAAVSSRPMAHWFTGTSDANVGKAVAHYIGSAGSRLPVLVAYDLPGRDACGSQSAGGAAGVDAYEKWISDFATGIGKRSALVVLEPDSLGDFDCMTTAEIGTRLTLLNYATRVLAAKAPNTWTYLDAGNADWGAPATMAQRLRSAGVGRVHGFSVNVSNFISTAKSRTYASRIKAALKLPVGYLIDTSRNGNGDNGQWCNPAGRKLGVRSTADPGALELWIKDPGNSDGECGIAPTTPAGSFSPALAQHLITGA